MSGDNLLADTNIFIYLLNGDTALSGELSNFNIYTSFICDVELYSSKKFTAKETAILNELRSSVTVIGYDEQIRNITIGIRKKYPAIKLPDCFVVATAIYLNVPLISADKQFQQVSEITLYLYKS